jgi:hypothetical protein
VNKKILIIAYYWPPSGGSGVQRWLKFVKYLPQFGWEPHVFTPENPAFSLRDESLLKDIPEEAEIIHFPIWEPYDAFFKISKVFGIEKSDKPADTVTVGKPSLFQKIAKWTRSNFFIPDPRIFWVNPSVKFLTEYLQQNKINTVITTGPPHSVHLIGYNLKKKNSSIKWIADFRDPWSEWGLLDSLGVSEKVRRKHKQLEFNVLSTADIVTTITPFYVRHFERLGQRKVNLLTNGFDEDDFKDLRIIRTEKFTIRHAGIVNEKCDPRPFMLAIKNLLKQESFAQQVRIEFIGEVNSTFKNFVNDIAELKAITFFIPTVPHKQLLPIYGTSSILLLILTGYKDAAGYMPGKLFEYIATGLPVLGVGPTDGDAANLISESNAGKMIGSDDEEGIKNFVLETYQHWTSGRQISPDNKKILYSRKTLTGRLVQILTGQATL